MHRETIAGFGREWKRFDQGAGIATDLASFHARYFRGFPWGRLDAEAVGFDLGCGSGRWAQFVAPRVGRVVCIDASTEALRVARRNLAALRCAFVEGDAERLPIRPGSMDFGYCLGVLHHTLDPQAGVRACATALKPGAPFLVYLYYALENRPWWYRALWHASDLARRVVARLPYGLRFLAADCVAFLVYWPLARLAALVEDAGLRVEELPLSAYRRASVYTMRTDALDRLGTRVEKRFSAGEIRAMLHSAGFTGVELWGPPYWCAVGYRAKERAQDSEP